MNLDDFTPQPAGNSGIKPSAVLSVPINKKHFCTHFLNKVLQIFVRGNKNKILTNANNHGFSVFLARTENLTSGKKLQRNVCGMGIIMNGEERREKLVELLKNTESPLSGTRLSRLLHVSRQAIVNDIAC